MLDEGVTVKIELPEVTLVGLKLEVAPAGSPLTLNATDPANPLSASTFTVYRMLPPLIAAVGDTDKMKSCPLASFTLSKVAVAGDGPLPPPNASPMKALAPMSRAIVPPLCVQLTPSTEVKPLKLLPTLVSFSQTGAVTGGPETPKLFCPGPNLYSSSGLVPPEICMKTAGAAGSRLWRTIKPACVPPLTAWIFSNRATMTASPAMGW